MNFKTMRLQRASLCKGFLAEIALVGTNASVGSSVSFQVECVIEALAAECAQVPLHIRVAFHVTIEQSLESEVLGANTTDELSVFLFSR